MMDTEKIEKQLFNDEPVFLKEVEGNKGQKKRKKLLEKNKVMVL